MLADRDTEQSQSAQPEIEESVQPAIELPSSTDLEDNEDLNTKASREAETPIVSTDERPTVVEADNNAEHSSSAPAEETSPDSEMVSLRSI